jgi:starch phosphorylase
VGEYLRRFYVPAAERGRRFEADQHWLASDVAKWKKRVAAAWPRVQARAISLPPKTLPFGEFAHFVVGVNTAELQPGDIAVELLLDPALRDVAPNSIAQLFQRSGEKVEGGEHKFILDLAPELCGKLEYRIRAYPFHPALSHRFEMGLMKWI